MISIERSNRTILKERSNRTILKERSNRTISIGRSNRTILMERSNRTILIVCIAINQRDFCNQKVTIISIEIFNHFNRILSLMITKGSDQSSKVANFRKNFLAS